MKALKMMGWALATTMMAHPIAASAQTCLTAGEAQALVRVALPDVLGGVADKCKASLSGTSFIVQSGAGLTTRYKGVADAAWPSVKPSLAKLAGEQAAMLTSLPDEAIRPLMSTLIAGEIGKGVKPEQCPQIDRALAAIAPLPAENMADLLVAILELSSSGKANSKLSICPTPASIPAPVSKPVGSTATK